MDGMSIASPQPWRLAAGGRVDRARPLNFTFDGRPMQGFAGDTLASALLAGGVDVVGRSFKYGRPRGIVGQGAEEPNAIVRLGGGAASTPNLRATQVELYEGLEAHSNLGQGLKRFAGLAARLLPAGFYYKTFMAPKGLWMFWERLLRHAAGLGEPADGPDPDCYDKLNQHCDVLVVGGGPAGLSAALAAARAGARVILADEQAEFGGRLLASRLRLDDGAATDWVAAALAELRSHPEVTLLPRSTVFGYYDHNFLAILERRTDHLSLVAPQGKSAHGEEIPAMAGFPDKGAQRASPPAAAARPPTHEDSAQAGSAAAKNPRQRLHRVRAKQVVLATGALERPLVFANNDLPGVMLASALSAYVVRYGVAPGKRLLLCTTNDQAYQAALDWLRAGREVVAVVDVRPNPQGALVQETAAAGVALITGHGLIEALGGKRVRGALIAPLDAVGGRLTGKSRRLDCDLIASSGGWSPTIHLSSQAGAKPRWSEDAVAFLPGAPRQSNRSAGAAAGACALADCLRDGTAAGAEAAALAGCGDGRPPFRQSRISWQGAASVLADEPSAAPQQALFLVPHHRPSSRAPKQFVDLQLDVTAADIELAAREGYESVEHVKRYTALGFGTDQGKLGNVNGVAILARALGRDIADTGTTVFRPAYTPVTFGAIAGREQGDFFDPERRTPMHDWHQAQGAAWENVGRWKRPWHYPQPGETMRQAVDRECLAVRNGVGIMDVSTLGKIDLQGPDVAMFLDRIYTGGFLKLGVGRCRYGLMLREDGTVFDDGVSARLDEHRYLMHTTTGNAEAVFAWLELWRQTEWPELRVCCTSVTDHWATAALAGPKAREVLRKVCLDIDLSTAAFPFMALRCGRVAGVPARVFRISFSGELSFEVNVPAHQGQRVWNALMKAGREFGITPYGTEAMHVLRAEKGFIIVGQETDGSMTPDDLGMGWAVRQDKAFGFIGDRSLDLADHRREDRLQLVGLKTLDGQRVIPEGAHILSRPDASPPAAMQGHVTSSYFSAALNRSIALAMLKGGRKRMGETVHCPLADGQIIPAQVVSPVFYDPDGERQRG